MTNQLGGAFGRVHYSRSGIADRPRGVTRFGGYPAAGDCMDSRPAGNGRCKSSDALASLAPQIMDPPS